MRSIKGLLVGLTLIVSGCGGGGGYSPPPPANHLTSAPGDAALGQYLQTSHGYTLNAGNSGDTYTIVYSVMPLRGTGHLTFNGNGPAYGETDTIALSKNGVLVTNSMSNAYYLLNPVVPLGKSSYYGSTPWGIVTSSFPLPATLTVGNAGAFDNVTYYHDLTMSTVDADETNTYSVTANNTTTLLLCLNSTISGVTAQGSADGLANGSESDCYSVNASGAADLVSIALTVDGVELNFK